MKMCDIIFGESNFIENFIWIKNSTKNLSKTTSTNHEYIVTYAKNINIISEKKIFRVMKPGLKDVSNILKKANEEEWSIEKTENALKQFYKENPDLKGISQYHYVDYVVNKNNNKKKLKVFGLSDLSAPKSTGKAESYEVLHPITKKPCKIPKRGWAYNKTTMESHIENNLIYFYEDETHVPRFKKYLDTVTTEVIKSTFSDFTDGKKELMNLFDGEAYFDNAKPTTVISKFVELCDDDDIILDFFSGSASTAHAVMKSNMELNKNLKFIMIQLPEETNEKSEAYKGGYKTISDLGKDRIRKAGDKLIDESKNNDLDIGFKVFKLDSSNLEKWNPDYNNIEQTLLTSKYNIKSDRTSLDLVYEIMLKYGIDLTLPIEEYKNLYSIGAGALVICLDNNVTTDIVDDIIEAKGDSEFTRVVFKDSGFKSDQDKVNIKETLNVKGIDEFITI